MDGTYLGYLMNSQLVRQQLNKYGTGATVIHIYPDDLKKIKVPHISKEEQVKIGKKLEVFASNIQIAEEKIDSSKSLQKSKKKIPSRCSIFEGCPFPHKATK